MKRYRDRTEAGERLAVDLRRHLGDPANYPMGDPVVVLGVPRGGVIVAAAVAAAMGAPLDVALARKLPAPGNPELAIGAIGEGGDPWLNRRLIAQMRVSPEWIATTIERETSELQRRARRYRSGGDRIDVAGSTAVVVDDGVATGATLAAVLDTVNQQQPQRLICAVPVGHPESLRMLANHGAEVVCPLRPWSLGAVGWWYHRFEQTSDDEVVAALRAG
ncbi:MAG: phosphoribosyltransferase [Actinomycetota bacterium]|nr:phosphoribosyltransferase [Actinomycetota bacterium]